MDKQTASANADPSADSAGNATKAEFHTADLTHFKREYFYDDNNKVISHHSLICETISKIEGLPEANTSLVRYLLRLNKNLLYIAEDQMTFTRELQSRLFALEKAQSSLQLSKHRELSPQPVILTTSRRSLPPGIDPRSATTSAAAAAAGGGGGPGAHNYSINHDQVNMSTPDDHSWYNIKNSLVTLHSEQTCSKVAPFSIFSPVIRWNWRLNPEEYTSRFIHTTYATTGLKSMPFPQPFNLDRFTSKFNYHNSITELLDYVHNHRIHAGFIVGEHNAKQELIAAIRKSSSSVLKSYLTKIDTIVNVNFIINAIIHHFSTPYESSNSGTSIEYIYKRFAISTAASIVSEVNNFIVHYETCVDNKLISDVPETKLTAIKCKFAALDIETIMKRESYDNAEQVLEHLVRNASTLGSSSNPHDPVSRISATTPTTSTTSNPSLQLYKQFMDACKNSKRCTRCFNKNCSNKDCCRNKTCETCKRPGHTKTACFQNHKTLESIKAIHRVSASTMTESILTCAQELEINTEREELKINLLDLPHSILQTKAIEPLFLTYDSGAYTSLVPESIAKLYGYNFKVADTPRNIILADGANVASSLKVTTCDIAFSAIDVEGNKVNFEHRFEVPPFSLQETLINVKCDNYIPGERGTIYIGGRKLPLVPNNSSMTCLVEPIPRANPLLRIKDQPIKNWSDFRLSQPTNDDSLQSNLYKAHCALNHAGRNKLVYTCKEHGISVSPTIAKNAIKDCEICTSIIVNVQGPDSLVTKRTANATHKEVDTEDHLVNQWVCDTVQIGKSYNGTYATLVCVQRNTNYWYIKNIRSDAEVAAHLSTLFASDVNIKSILTDNGTEFNTHALKAACLRHGVAHLQSAPYSPATQGLAEVTNKYLTLALTKLCLASKVDFKFWPLFINAASHCHNVTATKSGSPHFRRFGHVPSIETLPLQPIVFKLLDGKTRKGQFLSLLHKGAAETIEITDKLIKVRHIYPKRIKPQPHFPVKDIRLEELDLDDCESHFEETIDLLAIIPEPSTIIAPETPTTTVPITQLQPAAYYEGPGWALLKDGNKRFFPAGFGFKFTSHGYDPKLKRMARTSKDEVVCYVPYGTKHDTPDDSVFVRAVINASAFSSGTTHNEATKDDIKSGVFDESMNAELEKFLKRGVLEKDDSFKGYAIPVQWRYTWKFSNGIRKPKSRLVARGDLDKRTVNSYVAIPDAHTRRLGICIGLSKGWKCALADVETAFLQAEFTETVHINLKNVPIGSPIEPGTYKLKKAMYGLRESPKLFIEHLRKIMTELNFAEKKEGLFSRDDSIISAYVDDLAIWSDDPMSVIKQLSTKIDFGETNLLTQGETLRCVGWDIKCIDDKNIEVSMDTYIADLPQHDKDVINSEMLKLQEESKPINSYEYPKLIGSLTWLSTAYPSVAFTASTLAAHISDHDQNLLEVAKRAVTAARKLKPIVIKPVDLTQAHLQLFTDASYNHVTRRGKLGWILILADNYNKNIIAWRSANDKRLHNSTASAELGALVTSLVNAGELILTIRDIINQPVPLQVYTDNNTLIAQLNNSTSADFSVRGRLQLAQQLLRDLKGQIVFVPSNRQLADSLTKFISFPNITILNTTGDGGV